MTKLASEINKDDTKMTSKRKPKNQLLYELQIKFKELYDELTKILSGKKGTRVFLWYPVAKSTVKNLFNCWKAKSFMIC